jgi:hypothetical protein
LVLATGAPGMDRAHNRLVEIKGLLRELGAQRRGPRQVYTDATVVLMFYLSVARNQPRAWACDPDNWPFKMPPGGLPSESQLSRRLRCARVRALLDHVERRVRARDAVPATQVTVLTVDGRGLAIGRNSRDRDSGYGFAAGGTARGYKLHLMIDACGRCVCWRLTPMQTDEREMARRMLRDVRTLRGYVLADMNYDSTRLFAIARERGMQLVVPRRCGTAKNLAKTKQDPARLRSRDMLENTQSEFGRELYRRRGGIERVFGTHACTPELLTHLPPWVRTRARVRPFVQAKLTLAELHRQAKNTAA